MSAALTLAQARRISLAAQGLAKERPASLVTARQVGRTFDLLHLVQIDSVNVLTRSQYLPFFSRLGPYDIDIVHRLAGRKPRRMVEYWAHEASFVDPAVHSLLLERNGRWKSSQAEYFRAVLDEHRELTQSVLRELGSYGPMTASALKTHLEHDEPRTNDHWGWNWSSVKKILEALFWFGEVSAASRNPQFERRYDLTHRVIPPHAAAAAEVNRRDATIELTERAARAHGIGTVRCFADYFRVGMKDAALAVEDLVRRGTLEPVQVRGWDREIFRHVQAKVPRKAAGRALLSPFDSLVFERRRLEELFNFHYRIEIYTPAPKRKFGYYVLPFLLRDRLVGRVDLKADRTAGRLLVRGSYAEPDAPDDTAVELYAELSSMAGWLGLDDVVVEPVGNLAEPLAAAAVAGYSPSGNFAPQRDVTHVD
ncbi:winged helix-turn-helix domain-containing protein [Arthrobacter sp. H14]|uniref:winged helix-turn-helix domain-containing protein n=1 Tax=Arthrobacter sp. H14 TaxID=1312959 RepID=UPI000567AA1A|nr:crosslink repair DNA glycosylase YcaQ family protein [Arthrobacter sp. H14]